MKLDSAFWARVDTSGECWLWMGYRDSRGYGQLRRNQKTMYAHRYSLTLAGIEPGESVDHVCLTPSCVRPDHLRSVTNKQNHEHLSGAYRNSRSGVRGVYWDARCGRWAATIGHNGERHFKRFGSLAEATTWARAKRLELFTHNDLDRVG